MKLIVLIVILFNGFELIWANKIKFHNILLKMYIDFKRTYLIKLIINSLIIIIFLLLLIIRFF